MERMVKGKPEVDEKCSRLDNCGFLEAERERANDSLRAHLSEQRHDFFNLLQVIYGYTQLKKSDKVLQHIKDYCRQMENIGRLYNCKCIKLADLLYTKDKEAESIDMKLQVYTELNSEISPEILDNGEVLDVIDHVLSGFLYVLDGKGCKNTNIIFKLKEDADSYRMEAYCREIRDGQLAAVDFTISGRELFWKKIERSVMCFDEILKRCKANGFDGSMLADGATFVLSIRR